MSQNDAELLRAALNSSTLPRILLNSNSNSNANSNSNSRSNTPTRSATSPSVIPASPGPAVKKMLEEEKQRAYKHIAVSLPHHLDDRKDQWEPSVSFDTVAVKGKNWGLPDESSRGRSPSRSRSSSRHRDDGSTIDALVESAYEPFPLATSTEVPYSRLQNAKVETYTNEMNSNGYRDDYPSESAIRGDFFTLAQSKADLKTKTRLTWLVYITGRRHTWVALDYVIGRLLRDGDHLVVVSRIPTLSEGSTESNEVDPQPFKKKAHNIREYIERIADDSVRFKLTIDLFVHDSTEDVLDQCIGIYSPHVIVVSFKPSTKFLESKSWLATSRITHRLIKNFPAPIMVVPALTTNEFEVEFFHSLSQRKGWDVNVTELRNKLSDMDHTRSPIPDSQLDKLLQKRLRELASQRSTSNASLGSSHGKKDGALVSSDEGTSDDASSVVSKSSTDSDSGDSDQSVISKDRFLQLTEAVKRRREELKIHFDEAALKPMAPTWFMDNLNKIGDVSSKVAEEFEKASAFSETEDLVRTLTGLPKLEKHKSMLDVLCTEDESTIPEKRAVAQLKKQLTHSVPGSTSGINLSQSGGSSLRWNLNARASKIRSTDLRKTKSNVLDSDGRGHSPSSRPTSGGSVGWSNLQTSVSNDSPLRHEAMQRAKSESVVSTLKSRDKSQKKGLFRSFFRKS